MAPKINAAGERFSAVDHGFRQSPKQTPAGPTRVAMGRAGGSSGFTSVGSELNR